MEYVRLGSSGLRVSRLCLGMMSYGTSKWRPWVLDEPESKPFVRHAWEQGINFFDTADMYSNGVSEEVLGRALKEIGARDQIVVATKVFFPHGPGPNQGGLSRKHIFHAIDASLGRLGLDHIDLYIIHRWDPNTEAEETMEALHDVVRAGKARYLGASSMPAWRFAKAQHVAERNGWTKFVSMQNHYNLIYREEEREMIPLCRDQGVGITPWSPIARGFLTGNRRRGEGGEKTGDTTRARTDDNGQKLYYTAADFEVAKRVQEVAAARGNSPAQVAIAWMLGKPGITSPIIGATKLPQLDDLLGAVGLALTDGEVKRLEELYTPHSVLGHTS